jgi:hypothetical protein
MVTQCIFYGYQGWEHHLSTVGAESFSHFEKKLMSEGIGKIAKRSVTRMLAFSLCSRN